VRVDVSPRHVTAEPGVPVTLTVTVTNTGTLISGHQVRVLGLDPAWSEVTGGALSLFPSTSGTATVVVTLPGGIPAGRRTLEVEVRELTEPGESVTVPVELSVPAESQLSASVDPTSITAGRTARVAVVLANAGTAETEVPLEGKDDTGTITFAFEPAAPVLGPGERVIASAQLSARRPWTGNPKIRPYRVEAGPPEAPVVAQGAWVQPPRLSRGALALLALLIAGTVFAAVLSATLSQVVGQSNADRALALKVAEANRAQPPTGTASIAGVVTILTTGHPVSGVTVSLYKKGDTASPIASTATDASGAYHFSGLAAGSYELSYSGAGFAELWYPGAISAASAKPVTLTSHQAASGVDIAIDGLPATLAGQVSGPNVAGAVLTVQLPSAQPVVSSSAVPAATALGAGGTGSATATGAGSGSGAGPTGGSTGTGSSTGSTGAIVGGESAGGTVVTSVTLGASGVFDLTGIPSPATYQLVVIAAGDAPAVQEITLGGGQDRTGITIVLTPGNGAISGSVASATGPVGGATVTATSGSTSFTTVSVTTPGSVGDFSLSSLPSPATISLTVAASGFASQTLSVSLTADEHLTGLAVDLLPGQGSITGTVTTPSGTPPGGVLVSASNGTATVTTVTSSVGQVGSYALTGLAVPGTYTVTFSRADLESQTVDLALSVATPDLHGVDQSLVASTASLSGVVTSTSGGGIAEVAVSLVSGTTSYQVTTAAKPTAGAYAIGGITPGTYTLNFAQQGGVPVSSIVTLAAGQQLTQSPVLAPPASITGIVVDAATGKPLPGAQVSLYLTSAYPTQVAATTTTNSAGAFTFTGVEAPQDYLVAVAYPVGTSPQVTVEVTTAQGQSTPVCGATATGSAGGSSTSASSSGGTCPAATQPIKVTA
jgi:5-hydroxyisourate hydrolase-like protein (transthyretin family)